MLELSPQEIRDEVTFLVAESAEEIKAGSSQSAVSMLIEAQCLLADLIPNELNRVQSVPSLAPSDSIVLPTAG